jgi:uncharacterized membrane protein
VAAGILSCYQDRMITHASMSQDAALFEALIVPHRSLSRRGLWFVVGGFIACFAVIAARFWLIGAWPVVAFSALEIPAVALLLYVNARRGRASELVLLGPDILQIIRTEPSGRRTERVLSAAWLRVSLEEETGRISRLILRSRAKEEEVGTALGETEKRDLAQALRHAVYRMRNPTFNNPQLGD